MLTWDFKIFEVLNCESFSTFESDSFLVVMEFSSWNGKSSSLEEKFASKSLVSSYFTFVSYRHSTAGSDVLINWAQQMLTILTATIWTLKYRTTKQRSSMLLNPFQSFGNLKIMMTVSNVIWRWNRFETENIYNWIWHKLVQYDLSRYIEDASGRSVVEVLF